MAAFDPIEYMAFIDAKSHDEAIAYVDRFRLADPDDPKLRRFAALARGGKGEHILGSSEQIGVVPSPERLEQMIEIFNEAIAIDPTLADPYWDLAVIYGRFLDRPDLARANLAKARELDYWHPMMTALEALIAEGG